jgi:hemoglobin/transferrin/lactoferrin receptor protein
MYNKSLLSASIILALTSTAHAEDYALFDEVVVSATRTEQSKDDVSAAIESVSSEDIDAQLASDVKDALKYTPGVSAQGSGRFGISGFNVRGMEDSRIKVMVDDVQQPVPYNPGASEQRKYPNAIEVDTLTAIEVNKGPSSTLYGSDALGGVVLFRTKNPDDVLVTDGDEHRFGIKSSYSSADEEFKNTLTWAMREGKLETIVMATYANGSETQTHGSGADVEGSERGAANPADSQLGNLLAKAYYQLNDDHRIGLITEYYNKQYDENELHYNGHDGGIPGYIYTNNRNEDLTERTRVGFEHEWALNSFLTDTIDWSLNYQDSGALYKNYDTTAAKGDRMRERDAQDTSIQFNIQASKLAALDSSTHEFTFGANYVKTDFSLDNTDYFFDTGTSAPGATGIPDAELTQWGIFLQDQAYLLDEQLILTAGARYDSYKADPSADDAFTTQNPTNTDSALTGKLGAVYHLNESLSAFGQISQGFKAPTVYDLYYFYGRGATILPNPDLKAETSISYEAGLRGKNQSTQFELTAFINDYKDFIVQEEIGANTYQKTNLDSVEIYGVEFTSTTHLDTAFDAPQGMYTKLSVAFAEGEDKKSGDGIDSVAPLTANFGIGLDRDTYGALANINMVASKTDWSNEDYADSTGYTVVDLTGYYRPINDLTLRAGLFNVLDKKYWLFEDFTVNDFTGTSSYDARKTQPGRNWGVSLDYQF